VNNLGIEYEISGPRTLQRNDKVERNFQTLYGRIRAMLNDTGLKDEIRNGVWIMINKSPMIQVLKIMQIIRPVTNYSN
jgi:hypothetical protein